MEKKQINMPPLHEKILKCKYCSLVVHIGDFTYRLPVPQIDATRKLIDHYRVCLKATDAIKAKLIPRGKDDKTTRGETNCPICGDIKRSDKILSHIRAKHCSEYLIRFMPLAERLSFAALRFPVLKCYKDGKMVFRFCLHCRKGMLGTAIGTICADSYPASIIKSEKHTACRAAFDEYKELFEIQDPQQDLPFHLMNFRDPKRPMRRAYAIDAGFEPESETESAPINTIQFQTDAATTSEVVELKAELKAVHAELNAERAEWKEKDAGWKEKFKATEFALRNLTNTQKEKDAKASSGCQMTALLRKIADDPDGEMDTDDLVFEVQRLFAKSTDNVKPYEKRIAQLLKEQADLKAHIAVTRTISFSKGGGRDSDDSDESDSDESD